MSRLPALTRQVWLSSRLEEKVNSNSEKGNLARRKLRPPGPIEEGAAADCILVRSQEGQQCISGFAETARETAGGGQESRHVYSPSSSPWRLASLATSRVNRPRHSLGSRTSGTSARQATG